MESIDAYMSKGIKEVIREFPAIEAILDESGIGCGPCMVGTCQLKDIVDIHDLPAPQKREMMDRITGKIMKVRWGPTIKYNS